MTLLNVVKATILVSCFAAPGSLVLAADKYDGVESDSIEVIVNADTGSGFVVARGCERCPVKAAVDETTLFLHKNKIISLKQAQKQSLRSGTLVYEMNSMHAVKVLW